MYIQIPPPIAMTNTIKPTKSGASNLTKKTTIAMIIIKAMIPIITVPIVDAVPKIIFNINLSSQY